MQCITLNTPCTTASNMAVRMVPATSVQLGARIFARSMHAKRASLTLAAAVKDDDRGSGGTGM